MRRIINQIFILSLFTALLSLQLSSYTLDWDDTDGGWSSGDLSHDYSNVDRSGIDINVSITGDTGNFKDGYPSDEDGDSIQLFVDFDSNTQEINTTITFSQPVILRGIRIRDIDSNKPNKFDDKVIIEAKDENGNSVTPTNIVKGAKIDEDIAGKAYESDNSGNLNETDPDGFLTFDLENITEFTITYTSGDNAKSDPDQQAIWLDNLTFYTDTDRDGIDDYNDIDNDNDGIKDVDEYKRVISDTNDTSGTISDNDCLDRTFTISEVGKVSQLSIDVDIDHNYRGDLNITLKAPDGTEIELSQNNGGNYDNIKAYFEENATESIVNYNQDMNSMTSLQPEGSLHDFVGVDYNGTWTLHICDTQSHWPFKSSGTFNSATLHIIEKQDTDGDGLTDDIDLDSDNDGIPDNVEAQTTADYKASSGNDSDGDGLDDSYDTDSEGTYVTLPDTDSDGTADFRDTDSDDDGLSDCKEGIDDGNVSGKYCPVQTNQLGSNGLVNWAEDGGNDQGYSDTNGIVDDSSSADTLNVLENNGTEANFRIFEDTDGDGVSDFYDIDDDNDGILDSVEIQGGGGCPYGFFHVIDGQLYIFDVENEKYLEIGRKHKYLNAMGLDNRTGTLYISARRNGETDKDGNTISKNDILIIDRYSGELKKVNTAATINSYSSDIYDGVFYFRDNSHNNKGYYWVIGADSTYSILDDNIKTSDFSITPNSNGEIVGYGIQSGQLHIINFTTNTITKKNLTIIAPDGGDIDDYWGATFFATNNGNLELYVANNRGGYIYQIEGFDTDNPTAVFRYKSIETRNNDGASCRDANQYPVDSDGDGIPDYHDLDSDNDGIPDNVEAQSTSGYTAPSGNDADGDGLDDAYDENTSGVPASYGLIPPDTDGDHYADFVDNDSDNDGYSDCEEGYIDASNDPSNYCPVDNSDVGNNGLVSWAEDSDDYSDVNGKIDDPENDLYNETGDTTEVGYREFLCGKSDFKITAYQWRLISPPCNTGDNTISDLFGDTLGEYGDDKHWVMYEQTGDDNYEVNSTHDNTDKRLMSADDTLEVGKSYWIIADSDNTLNIDKNLTGLSPTATTDSSTVGIEDNNFTEIKEIDLPANSDENCKKYMSGNVFPYAFDLSDLYFKHDTGTYYPMGDSNNDSYISPVVYIHDSSKISGCDGYVAVDPSTPGFAGQIKPMEGFFIKLEINSSTEANKFAFPLEMQNAN